MFDQQIDILKHLWDPVQFLLLSSVYSIVTTFNLITSFQLAPFRSFSSFKDAWFATFWGACGSLAKEMALPSVEPLVKQAYGVVLDIGPGAGDWLYLFDKERATKIYGVEPNKDHHASLRENIKKAGLTDIYEILGVGVEDLGSQGIELGSVDTVVTVQCLCSIPTPKKMIQSLAGYIKPGGQWIVYEHVKTHQGGWIEKYQSLLDFAWPHFFGGCSITRDTEKWLRESADWSSINLKPPIDEKRYQIIPHTMGSLANFLMKAIFAVPATLALVYRAWSHKSLTPVGIAAAVLTAIAHAIHPWNLPFVLLIVFFLAGTRVTKVKHDVKARLTVSASGSSGGEGARTHVQVLSNSAVASVLSILHAYQLRKREQNYDSLQGCYSWPGDLLILGIVANYVAVAADTFSSELGILSKTQPRLIVSPTLRNVPPGTNGGVTVWGLVAGLLGSFIIAATSIFFIPFCQGTEATGGWDFGAKFRFLVAFTIWGLFGSILDSVLGGLLQESVLDTRSGRIVEGEGGTRVLVPKAGKNNEFYKMRIAINTAMTGGEGTKAIAKPIPENAVDESHDDTNLDKYDARKKFRTPSFGDEKPSRVVESGSLDLLDNNQVNFLMALTMSLGAMAIASWFWEIPFDSILSL
ncbi:hypothetical protein B7463_g6539, partial [Scytalidium lignicola]